MMYYCLASYSVTVSLAAKERDFFLTKDYSLLSTVVNMLTKIGPNVFGTHIDNKRRTRMTPTKDLPVPGGPYNMQDGENIK